ncbi:MAG TPA: hypothetical protein VHX44_18660 [Planctomycetota bacterium]|nr:hypothetical protein [Planctomycetota bacterium]
MIATLLPGAASEAERSATVAHTPGLIAFWDFIHCAQGRWTVYHDPTVTDHDYPVSLRRIGDAKAYTAAEWPYGDADSRLEISDGGPFGKAVRFNQGYVFAEVPRAAFDGTPLDLSGLRPFTLLAWTRFTGKRHLVAGVWDEGGWDRYGGRRQFALFGGLFGSQGTIAHISATGAASFPQSKLNGSQYARLKAIDGASFANDQWVCMGMSFDPERGEVSAYLNGVRTKRSYADNVQQDVTGAKGAEVINPAPFPWPVFGPRNFLFKFNGYQRSDGGIGEHALHLDLDANRLRYARIADTSASGKFQVRVDVRRDKQSLLPKPIMWDVTDGGTMDAKGLSAAQNGDVVAATLWLVDGKQIGTEVIRTFTEGVFFTFGRALGLKAKEKDHGSQLQLSGVAVFNRVLTAAEMQSLSFVDAAK